MTILALTCFLVVGAAAASILGRDSVPAARLEMASPVVKSPVSNRESKKDRLAVVALAMASFEPPQTASLSPPLRQAYASESPADIQPPKVAAPAAMPLAPLAPAKPRLAAKPQVQKSYALLSDVQIAGIKERLKLSADQESYWPAVESALRAKRHRRADRSRRRRSPAAEIGRDAAVVPAARGSKAGSAHARPHHRAGKSRVDDLSWKRSP